MNKTLTETGLTRRNFLKCSAVGAVSLCAPLFVPASLFGKSAPSNRINVGVIGCGNQSTVDIPEWLKLDDCQVVAVCDVNKASYGYKTPKQFLGRDPQRDFVNRFYANRTGNAGWKGCAACTDFRDVLRRKDIDAVAIITPDHWHAIMTIQAAKAGKDIYCQKPLSLTVEDGQMMVKAVRRYGRILQTGSQWRSNKLIRRACELVRNGRIGTVRSIETQVAYNNFEGPGPGWKPMPVPEGFDYDMWLGPAPEAPYHADRCLYKFRFIHDYSGGQTTNFGAHSNDVAVWALEPKNTGVVEVEDLGAKFPPEGSLFNTATEVAFRVKLANGVEIVCKTQKPGFGIRWEGTDGWLSVGYNKIESSPAAAAESELGGSDIRLPVSDDHFRDFIDAVKARRDPIEPVEDGHRTATLCHLGNIAMRLRRKIQFDPQKEIIKNDKEASAMLRTSVRAKWRRYLR